MKVSIKRWLALFFMASSVAACSNSSEEDQLKQKLSNIKQNTSYKPIDGQKLLPENPVNVQYQESAEQTPFREPAQLDKTSQGIAASPLQAYPITMLELIGTITEGDLTYAYIATPDKRIHRADYGDRIGDKNGRIVAIRPGKVDVEVQGKLDGQQSVGRVVILQLKDSM